jgi:F-type H+-transporting ATPase subunit delta
MSEAVVAKRYAEALFQIGKEKNTLDKLAEELRTVRKVFQDNQKQLHTFLTHPRVKKEQKKQFLQEVFTGLGTDVVHTLQLLAERHRIQITPYLADHFIHLVNDAKGIAEATVYSVRGLSDKEQTALAKNLAKRFNKQEVRLENTVDASMIGGMKIRIGNTIYDGSLSGKLRRLERNIATADK